jgi:16S rRNA (guanine966-N2)-methyltransferase
VAGGLRVVGGALSGRRFASKISAATRPTSDRVREAIASAVESRGGFAGTSVLDLFAGTGAMAIEALSRGARYAVLVERDRSAIRGIEQSLRALELADRGSIVPLDLSAPPASVAMKLSRAGAAFDRVLIDPPYAEIALVPPLLEALAGVLADGALIVLEHPSKAELVLGAAFETLTEKRYGDSAVLLARYAAQPPTKATR